MTWDGISAIAESVGTIAVLVTLVYLAVQMKIANKQREVESFRHTYDSINRVCELIAESTERAEIVLRGRESLSNLSDEERMVFEFTHLRFMNTVESWYMQLLEASPPGAYRDQQLENIAGVIRYFFDYPGSREIWKMVKHQFVPVQKFVDDSLASVEAS